MVVRCEIEVSAKDYYSCDLTRQVPVRVTIMTINGDSGLGIIESTRGLEIDIKQYISLLSRSPTIRSVVVTWKSEKAYWTRVEHALETPSIHESILESGCMTKLPIIIEQGTQLHSVLAPTRKALSSLIQNLRMRFSVVRIKHLHRTPWPISSIPLTDKQKEAIVLAWNEGYYELPRRCTLEGLAEKLDIKRVAMQERIRRAEKHIIASFIANLL